ncbi:LRR receptor-like serine/threonine-protein kinase GHR1 [Impatiens glandulifera]|uniref:LRR receptor-like serine/threonine-protein kinase GHR1 n=1 Tax=Impatiens glandulifera TaxID=253017 RepID=UPI001FB082BD|nr:LRR receptor-like serine/threonine-protein kinase GHR1 [Impatiens glandulifera]
MQVKMKLFWPLFFSIHFVYSLGQLPSQDILTLLEFKKGIKHDPTGFVVQSWNEESIDFNGCPSSWNGIVCNGENVAGVILNGLGLSADVDLSVFSNLTMLVKLSLANNSITGKIPISVGDDFKNLEYLDLSNNLFFSTVPLEIGKLGNLKNLSLAGNNFSGPIPDSISGLNSILSLDLSHNSFSGSIPSSMRRLTNLVFLNLSLNGFSDGIPKGFELMTNLQAMDFHGNNLSGNLDLDLLLLTSAVHIDFSDNSFVNSGSQNRRFLPAISDTITYLDLSRNLLTGSLVGGEAQIFGNLKFLDLSYNQLSGELPEFSFVYELQVLKLSNNRFTGFVPDGLLKGDSLVLTELDLSGNSLSGLMSMITSTTLHVLNLSSNGLSGDLPLLVGSCTILDLSNNQFGGNLTRLTKWANVEILDLSRNRLTGTIPEVTSQFLRLNYLNLSGNSFEGSLPMVVARFPKLTVLDLSFNQLNGSVMTELLSSTTLQEIHLENNLFVGEINISSPSPFQSVLQVLDLSHNQLDGSFSDGFRSLTGLKTLNLAANNLSGSLPTSMEELTSIVSLIISENHFTGPLPTNLSSSLVSFNASYNDLSGVVPENLRKFPPSAFFPGNSKLDFPNPPPETGHGPSVTPKRKPIKHIVKVIVIVACVVSVVILILLSVLIHYIRISKKSLPKHAPIKDKQKRTQPTSSGFTGRDNGGGRGGGGVIVSAEELTSSRKGSSSEIISQSEKMAPVTGFSPSKNSQFSWSPESGDSYIAENLSRLDVRSPDRLVGELYFLDDTISLTPEELSRAPAEVLGRSSHGTSYRATLDNGILLTVKWLREGVAKPRKDFAKEAKKFANIRHPNVVGLRGYYWGPTQHEKLILSDYISPGSLANFLYDRPGRKGPPLSWAQRLRIAVDVARGLNYLHFDRAMPHGNIKATNILLDGADLNARVADYCLHRLMTQAGTIEQILDAGVLGYRAPELASSKKPIPSFKSDVYAFGVILLELLTGKCAGDVVSGEDAGGVDLTDWVRLKVAEGQDCFDSTLILEMANPGAQKGMKEALGIALRCIRSVSERAGIKTIYEDLSSI